MGSIMEDIPSYRRRDAARLHPKLMFLVTRSLVFAAQCSVGLAFVFAGVERALLKASVTESWLASAPQPRGHQAAPLLVGPVRAAPP